MEKHNFVNSKKSHNSIFGLEKLQRQSTIKKTRPRGEKHDSFGSNSYLTIVNLTQVPAPSGFSSIKLQICIQASSKVPFHSKYMKKT